MIRVGLLLALLFLGSYGNGEEVLMVEVELSSNGKTINKSGISIAEGIVGSVSSSSSFKNKPHWKTEVVFNKGSDSLYQVHLNLNRLMNGESNFNWRPRISVGLGEKNTLKYIPLKKGEKAFEVAVTLRKRNKI